MSQRRRRRRRNVPHIQEHTQRSATQQAAAAAAATAEASSTAVNAWFEIYGERSTQFSVDLVSPVEETEEGRVSSGVGKAGTRADRGCIAGRVMPASTVGKRTAPRGQHADFRRENLVERKGKERHKEKKYGGSCPPTSALRPLAFVVHPFVFLFHSSTGYPSSWAIHALVFLHDKNIPRRKYSYNNNTLVLYSLVLKAYIPGIVPQYLYFQGLKFT